MMIEQSDSGILRNLLTSPKITAKTLSLTPGTIVKANVVETHDKNHVTLRILTPGSNVANPQGITLEAHSNVSLSKGQTIFLEILSGKKDISMRFIGHAKNQSDAIQQKIPAKFFSMLSQLSSSRLQSSELQQMFSLVKSLPQSLMAKIPEFQSLEKFFVDINQLDGKVLKALIETSGIASETRLKLSVMNNPGSIMQNIVALQTEGDLKTLLLRLKNLLRHNSIRAVLKQSGQRVQDIESITERCIRHIEFYQLTSKINDMFYTFLPVIWDEIKDGEFLFRQNSDKGKGSYACDINLDLERLGKISVSVTLHDNHFYVTVLAENESFYNLMKSNKDILEKRFPAQGLLLKALNIRQKKDISFGKMQEKEINVKI